MDFSLPPGVQRVLELLERAGYQAYLVGGCVRDALMGNSPSDYDVATSAKPLEAARALSSLKVLETGVRHGTITALSDGHAVEVTTFRADGAYADARRPDRVTFLCRIEEDLFRRDFTINAMAFHPGRGLIDPFGGQKDLDQKLIRAVGCPDRRFGEDALRILRAVRFSSALGFAVEEATARSLLSHRALLSQISPERISAELKKLLCGKDAGNVLLRYPEVVFEVIPELAPEFKLPQNHPYHCYDVWEHTAKSVALIDPAPDLRLAMLLHDAGKPSCHTRDKNGVDHFFGHPQASRAIARDVLSRLRLDRATVDAVCTLVEHHDADLPCEERAVRRWLAKLGPALFIKLLAVRAADVGAQAKDTQKRLVEISRLRALTDRIIGEKQCFDRKGLAINGDDLLALGLSGPELGRVLGRALGEVMDGAVPNERGALLALVRRLKKEREGR